MQVTGDGAGQFVTNRHALRYDGMPSSARRALTAAAAASPPFVFAPASRRRALLHEPSSAARLLLSQRHALSSAQPAAGDNVVLHGRKMLQTVTPAASFLWFDIQGDGEVTTTDSDTFFDVVMWSASWDYFNSGLVDRNEKRCSLLESLYLPSQSTGENAFDQTLDDDSFISTDSPTWQAVDPKLFYLRTGAPSELTPTAPCPSGLLSADQSVPQLSRFDDTVPPTQEQVSYLSGGASGVVNPNELWLQLTQPSTDAFLTYQVTQDLGLQCCKDVNRSTRLLAMLSVLCNLQNVKHCCCASATETNFDGMR